MNEIKKTYKGLDKEKEQFKYVVNVNGHKFDYFTGLGWIHIGKKGIKRKKDDKTACAVFMSGNHILKRVTDDERHTVLLSMETYQRDEFFENREVIYRKAPTDMDVLSCLKGDCDAGSMSFIDFCDYYGYDTDSIKATDIYRACMDTAQKLRGYNWPEGIDGY